MRTAISKLFSNTVNINNNINELYSLYNKTQYWDKDKLENYQLVLLNDLWKHAVSNVEYYKNFSKNNKIDQIVSLKDLYKIPIMEKSEFNKNINIFLSENINKKRFIKNSTSGSTGTNFNFFSDTEMTFNSKALYMRRYNWMDVSIFNKELIVWGAKWDIHNKSFLKRVKYFLKNVKIMSGYNLSDEDYLCIYKIIKHGGYEILNSYPSILDTMVDIFKEHDLNISPKAIVIGGEKLFLNQKNKIKNFFNSTIYDFYGARDMPNIAQSCKYDNGLHVFSENVIVEVVDENNHPIDEGEGDLVITSLHNYVMPFIRYKIGDRARINKYKVCDCGRTLPIIDEVIGRKMELITFPNGNRVMGAFWTLLFRSVKGIKDFQVIQESISEIDIFYTIKPEFNKSNIPLLLSKIHDYGGTDININFIKKDKIDKTQAGKMNFIISKIQL